jgi:serine/threonine protein kinase
VQGETLRNRLARENRLDEPLVRNVVLQLLDVLEYLQKLDPPMIHRDIKPANLIIDAKDQVHLIDFGAVRQAVEVRPNEPGTAIGTVGFSPDEQSYGNPVPASDLYALAATALNLVSGVAPNEWYVGSRLEWRNRMQYSPGFAEFLEGSLVELPRRFKSPTAARAALLGTGAMSQPTVVTDATPPRSSRSADSAAPTELPSRAISHSERSPAPDSGRPEIGGKPTSKPPSRMSRPLVATIIGVVIAGGLVAAAMVPRGKGTEKPSGAAALDSTKNAAIPAAGGDVCPERALKSFRTESQFDLRILCPANWTSFRSAEQRATRIMAPDGTQIWASVWTPATANESLEAFAERWRSEMQVALGAIQMSPKPASADGKTITYQVIGRRFATSPPGSVLFERVTAAGNHFFTWSLVVGLTPLSKPTAQEVLTSIEFLAPDAAQPSPGSSK